MSTSPNYYTIGIFVSAGLILILGAMIILGAGALWREHVYIETYIDGSIQGIDTGSSVKMRGVKIGNVQHIGFVSTKYPEARGKEKRYVLLEISISLKTFGDMTPDQVDDFLQQEINKGLRIRLQPMGLTGSAYLEMDYLDVLRHPPISVSWAPKRTYIPSAPGTFARLEETFESLSNTMTKIEELDLDRTLRHLDQLIVSLTSAVKDLGMHDLSDTARLFLEELRESNRKLSMIMGPESRVMDEDVNFYSLLSDAGTVVRDVRKGLELMKIDQDDGAMDQLAQTIYSLRIASEDLPETLESIKDAADSVRKSTLGFNKFTRSAYSLLATQSDKIDSIMRDLEITSRNLMELSTDAKTYPSYIFFGDQPLESDLK